MDCRNHRGPCPYGNCKLIQVISLPASVPSPTSSSERLAKAKDKFVVGGAVRIRTDRARGMDARALGRELSGRWWRHPHFFRSRS
jgi:hypothetical protein